LQKKKKKQQCNLCSWTQVSQNKIMSKGSLPSDRYVIPCITIFKDFEQVHIAFAIMKVFVEVQNWGFPMYGPLVVVGLKPSLAHLYTRVLVQ
ncbi:hypothetical protein XELAEV_18011628mg, partial [Xenopus laevis]